MSVRNDVAKQLTRTDSLLGLAPNAQSRFIGEGGDKGDGNELNEF
ncbi:hypothetical protein [Vibrio neonatus]|nr:hypothetical protein [Vibrio neonatus]